MRMLLVLLLLWPVAAVADAERPVDIAILTSLDRSESIDQEEAEAQIAGLIYALRHPRFHAVVAGGYHKRIALSVVTWSSFGRHELILPWMPIAGAHDADNAARWLQKFRGRYERARHGTQTDVAFGIEVGIEALRTLPWPASKKVINLVSDGISNIGRIASIERDAALARGITVNGLIMARGSAVAVLSRYFKREVIGGPTAFLQVSLSNDDFADAMLRKMMLEMVRLRAPSPRPRTAG